ncbi:type II toxin-antitoxin system HicA family toxin [bacterium]|nr:type II toxin-antitoxin system HicA family toxin [bacterium]
MLSLKDIPGEIKRKKFTKALVRLGFILNKSGGDGSHYKLIWPKTQKSIIVQSKVTKNVLRYLLKEIEKYSGLTWEDVRKEL